MGAMLEETLYKYLRNAYAQVNTSVYCPLTKDLIVHLIGYHGLDVLAKAKFIEPTEYPGHYVLCSEP
jgi:hypothetical protein